MKLNTFFAQRVLVKEDNNQVILLTVFQWIYSVKKKIRIIIVVAFVLN